MERLSQHSNKTELVDRTLWFDGDSTVAPDRVEELISTGMPVEGLFVEQLTADIKRYNKLVKGDEKITIKKGINPLDFSWNIPEEFKNLDVREYVCGNYDHAYAGKLLDEFVKQGWVVMDGQTRVVSDGETKRRQRVWDELDLYERLGLTDVLRVLIYVINTLQTHNVVWGVGRGSSVASYVLYLIGVHDIDSVEHDLDITDFLREEESLGEK